MSTFPKLKLTYFDAQGRAETIRLAFHLGDVPFVDERLSYPEFQQRKPTFVYSQVPVLEVDGVEMAQSQALLRYAGKLTGLYPLNDPLTALRVDEILGGLDELQDKIGPSMRENDPEKKKVMRLELANDTIPRALKNVEARVAKLHASPAFQSDKIYIHDLLIYAHLQNLKSGRLDYVPTTIANGYVHLNAVEAKVLAHPKVQQWNIAHAIKTPKLKLTYFDIPARAEPIRLAFTIGGIPFEDERIDGAELAKRRDSLPFGQIPVLDVNGEVLAQSWQILRYAGSLSGLYPTNDVVLALRVDEILGVMEDFYTEIGPTFRIQDADEHAQACKKLLETKLNAMMATLDARIAKWGGPFATGNAFTIADLAVYGQISNFKRNDGFPNNCADQFTNIMRVYSQVRNHEKIKDVAGLAEY